MKKFLLTIAIAMLTFSSAFAIGNFKVVVNKPGAAIDVQVRITDYSSGGLGTIYTGATQNLTPNSNGIIIVDVDGAGLASIDAADITSFYIVDVYTGNPLVLTAQQRLDQMIFEQAQAGVTDTEGNVVIDDAKELRFAEPVADGDNYVAFKAPALSGNVIYTLPVDAGTDQQVLTTDGTGNLSWTTPPSGGGGGGGCNIFGDGSAGDITISANTDWSTNPPANGNYMFNSLTINSGVTLTVASGTVIQSATTVTNNGTINVNTGVLGKAWFGNADGGNQQSLGNTLSERRAFGTETLRRMTHLGPLGGSGGSIGSGSSTATFGGNGGGTLTILAATGITNAGTINAQGGDSPALPGGADEPGVGGGGGGAVLLASDDDITNSGTINVSGGDGCAAGDASDARGGAGGGGGLIHFISPNANSVGGTKTVSGGSVGSDDGTVENGGNGGAGVGGNGGFGGQGYNPASAPTAGSSGLVLSTQVDACGFINR